MGQEMGGLAEAFPTLLAYIGFLSRVDSYVIVKPLSVAWVLVEFLSQLGV